MPATKGKKRAPQQSLALKEIVPVDSVPEKKSGSRTSHLKRVAEQIRQAPGQWFLIGRGKRQSAYQKRARLKGLDTAFEVEVRATDEDGISEIYARFNAPNTKPSN